MGLTHRIQRLERKPSTAPDGRRRCPTCRDGSLRRWVTRFDGVPAWGDVGTTGSLCCPGCGRENVDVVDVRGIDPARL